jgi:hypothetical protein
MVQTYLDSLVTRRIRRVTSIDLGFALLGLHDLATGKNWDGVES